MHQLNRQTPYVQKEVDEHIDDMLKRNVIEPSSSPGRQTLF